jgi:hypothetical protein
MLNPRLIRISHIEALLQEKQDHLAGAENEINK